MHGSKILLNPENGLARVAAVAHEAYVIDHLVVGS